MTPQIPPFASKQTVVLSPLHVSLKGEYRCVLNEGTDREVDTGWFDNLITDIGLDHLASGVSSVVQGSIGTGTTAPANGNTTLQAYVASVTSVTGTDSQSNIGASTYVAQFEVHWTYPQGAVVGNMAEVGVGWGTVGTSLFSRALILDGFGAPTTLTVTSLDQLTVYYKLTATPQLTDITGSVTLATIPYNYTGRISNCALWFNNPLATLNNGGGAPWGHGAGGGGFAMNSFSTQTLGAITSNPSGAASNGNSGATTVGSYTPGQKYLDNIFTAAPLECDSSGGVGSILFFFSGGQFQYQYSFAAASGGAVIPKDNTKTLSFTLRFSWDRV